MFRRDPDNARSDAPTLRVGDLQDAANHDVIEELHFECRGVTDGKTRPGYDLQTLLREIADLAVHGVFLPLKEALPTDTDPGLSALAAHAE